jgi:hypothetical protein
LKGLVCARIERLITSNSAFFLGGLAGKNRLVVVVAKFGDIDFGGGVSVVSQRATEFF